MKRKICAALFIISFFAILGIIGGVQNGEPFSNTFWCVPLLFLTFVSAKIGRLF